MEPGVRKKGKREKSGKRREKGIVTYVFFQLIHDKGDKDLIFNT